MESPCKECRKNKYCSTKCSKSKKYMKALVARAVSDAIFKRSK